VTDSFPQRISFADAGNIIDQVVVAARLETERVPLSRALGRVLSEDLVATLALPSFDNSAMDGYALRSADLVADATTRLQLIGEQFAGISLGLTVADGQCVRITTGAPMPAGADAVAIKEDAALDGEQVLLASAIKAGTHVRRAGEDVRLGESVLQAGQVLSPARLSLSAALGQHDLRVHRRPTVAVFTTGDELVAPGISLAPGQIYDSNRVLLQTLLAADGYEPVAWPVLPDDPARMAAALADAASSFDLVLTCGGVSAGEKDHLPHLLQQQGEVHFWRVRMRPGMPVLFGRWGRAQFLGLPGNPVSVFATYLTLARRLLDGMQGRAEPRPILRARLTAPLRKTHPRLEFLRGLLDCDDQACMQVTANPADGSHRLRAAADSNALIVLPEGAGDWAAGSLVEVLPLARY